MPEGRIPGHVWKIHGALLSFARRDGAGAVPGGRIPERSEEEILSALPALLREVKPAKIKNFNEVACKKKAARAGSFFLNAA